MSSRESIRVTDHIEHAAPTGCVEVSSVSSGVSYISGAAWSCKVGEWGDGSGASSYVLNLADQHICVSWRRTWSKRQCCCAQCYVRPKFPRARFVFCKRAPGYNSLARR